jgi:hypothetical protein
MGREACEGRWCTNLKPGVPLAFECFPREEDAEDDTEG